MPVVETAVATSAKIGVTTGLFTTAVIFTDPAYGYMALMGAIVGIASTFHTIYSERERKFNKMQVTAEMIKAFMLGLIAMPLSFLAISQGILSKIMGIETGEISMSLSLVASFAFSWYFTAIVDILLKNKKRRRDYD